MEEESEGTDHVNLSEMDVEVEEETLFAQTSLSLSPQLVNNLTRGGLHVPTEVQLQVIPKIRNARGKDLCVNAPTGSGKTLAYALPIVEVRLSAWNQADNSLSRDGRLQDWVVWL